MTTCRDCGTQWAGHRIEHCPVCHQTFAGMRSGDQHRTGDHELIEGPNRRRCRTPDEMRAGGMWTTASTIGTEIWHGEMRKDGQGRRNTRHSLAVASQNDEQPPTLSQVPPEKSGPQNATQGR